MAPGTSIRGKRVLVVEDEPVVAGLLAQMLAVDGHRVDTVGDGLAALGRIAEQDYDLIVSDLRMPGLDGRGFYEELGRRRPALARRLIFVTANAWEPLYERFLREAGVPCLPKPFSPEDLHRATQELLATREAR